ncbi:MAG: molybdopterin molybdotransferase MoeA [Candidatus Thiodiazotropha sp.]
MNQTDAGCDINQSAMKPVEEALSFLLQQARPVTDTETVALQEGLGRILARSVRSQVDVPPWDNSAMDGYAVRYQDLVEFQQGLRITQRIPAGTMGTLLEPGTAARIFTGAPVPPGADTVVIQEVCEVRGDQLLVRQLPTAAGANVRRSGEDILQGEEILKPGLRLAPQHLGLAASVGSAEVEVFRPLKVAVLSSGDELVMPGRPLGEGQIYNSNQFTLSGLVQRLGCEVIPVGIVQDTHEATCDALRQAAEAADLVLASGGVSVGEEDHVKPAVEQLGSLELWKIASRPGKPLAFGWLGDVPFLGAPGNPVSVFVTFSIFMLPFIRLMQGQAEPVRPILRKVVAGFEKSGNDKRQEYARGRLELDGEGRQVVRLFSNASSGVMTSVVWANGLVVLPPLTPVATGDLVDFIPFSELFS